MKRIYQRPISQILEMKCEGIIATSTSANEEPILHDEVVDDNCISFSNKQGYKSTLWE